MDVGFNKLLKQLKLRQSIFGRRDPFHDWKVIVISFLILNFLIVAGSLYLFWLINSGTMFASVGENAPKTQSLDRQTLRSIVDEFDQRRITLEKLQAEPARVADPSLQGGS